MTVDAAGYLREVGQCLRVCAVGRSRSILPVALGEVLQGALAQVGLPKDCVVVIDSTDRSVTDELFLLRDLVDVLIPRGGAGLIRHCVEHSLIPVIETGTGNCHIYIHESADLAKAYPIVLNAKTQRVGVCNACESVLVDRSIAHACLPELLRQLAAAKVRIHGDEVVGEVAAELDIPVEAATEEDWGPNTSTTRSASSASKALKRRSLTSIVSAPSTLKRSSPKTKRLRTRSRVALMRRQCISTPPLVSPMVASSA